uniref:Non-specific lipid-transfer protein n=1 Tax=Pisum sativum TaxID=3888 RepID=O24309_PEA|nr:non-specific lipid transfer protein [Pisum sativum]
MVVVSAPMAEAAISCGAVTAAVAPCFAYLKGAPSPSLQCCGGVRRLNGIPDRKGVCNCLKGAAGSVPGLKPGNVAALPANVVLDFLSRLAPLPTVMPSVFKKKCG